MAASRAVVRASAAVLASALAIATAGCGGADERASRTAASPAGDTTGASGDGRPAICARLRAEVTGHVSDPAATELSGLVLGSSGVLWTHGDSGAAPELLALAGDGRALGRVSVTGAEAVDWEDIAWARPPGSRPELLIGDIGDNEQVRDSVDVYRLREPVPADGPITSQFADRLRLRYPDGPHDAEALLVSPDGRELVIVTKAADGGRAYGASIADGAAEATLRRGPRVAVPLATGAAVSADGRTVALRGYLSIVAWALSPGESLLDALGRPPCSSPTLLVEGQGEAIALARDGRAFTTVVEGTRPALRTYVPAS